MLMVSDIRRGEMAVAVPAGILQDVHPVGHALQGLPLLRWIWRQRALQNGTAHTDEQRAPGVRQAPLHQARLHQHGGTTRERQHRARDQAQLQKGSSLHRSTIARTNAWALDAAA